MDEKFEELIDTFIENQVGISDYFLTPELALSLQDNLLKLDAGQRMRRGGIGNLDILDQHQTKRGDKIHWIDNETTEVSERAFLDRIGKFISLLNETCFTGIRSYEFHYALYETGSSYSKHVDQFKSDSDRKFSMINYLNSDWLADEGGELCIHHKDKIEKILPSLQKTVFFRSASCEHEVQVASRPRMSITGWLKSSSL